MRKTKLYNNLSDKLIQKTKLKKGETVTYRLYGITKAPMDPSRLAIPMYKNVPPIDQIWDEDKQEYVDIAAVKSVDAEGNHTFHEILFSKAQAGHLTLVGGRGSDQEIHSYLSICNYNTTNPERDNTKEAIFELVDEEAKAERESKVRNLKREALNAAADLSPEDVKNYSAALGEDDTKKVSILRSKLEQMADEDPQGFLDLLSNKNAVVKATINRAKSKGVVIFNEEQSRWEWPNKEAILTVSRGSSAVDELVTFCITSTKGEKVYDTIQSKSKPVTGAAAKKGTTVA